MVKQNFLTKMLLLCALIVGSVSSAWAEEKFVTISPSQALNDGGVDPITIVCAKGDGSSNPAISSGQLRLYQAASGKTTGNTITFSSDKTITKIVFTFANNMTADNGSFSVGSYDSGSSTWNGSTNSVTLTVTGTTSGTRIYITNMDVYYEDASLTGLSYSGTPTKTTYNVGESFDPTGLTVTATYDDSSSKDVTSSVVWTPDPMTVGTTSVTGTYMGLTVIVSGLTVNNVAKITITQDNLTSFTNAYKWYDWSSGGVSGKAYAYKNNGMQFNPSKDGYWIYNTTAIPGNIISVKMVKESSSTDRSWTLKAGTSEISAINNGTQIGNAQTVGTSGATWDVTGSYNYFLLYVSGGATVISSIEITYIPSTAPIINADATVDLEADDTSGEIAYTISNPVDGTSLTASVEQGCKWISDVTVGTDKVTFTTSANTGAERSADITLTYGSVTKTVTVTQADGTPVSTTTYTLASSFVPGRHYIIVGVNNNTYKAMGAQGSNNRAAVGITVNDGTTTIASTAGVSEVLLGVDVSGYFTLYDENENGYLYASCGTGTSNTMNVENTLDDYGRWTISTDNNGALIIKAQAGQKNQLQYNSGNSLFSCYSATQKNVYLFERDGDTGSQEVTATIAAACTDGEGKYYGTFSAPFAFTAPEGVTVSEIGINSGKLAVREYAEGAVIPANTGVMISSATSGEKKLTVLASGGTSVLGEDNCLLPSGAAGIEAEDMEDAAPSCKYYRLTMHNGTQIGFWWGAEGGAAFALAANKAYLAVPLATGAPSMGLWIDDDTTGIQTIERTVTDNQYYTLDGRRVAKPTKGLYIVNGRKVIVK